MNEEIIRAGYAWQYRKYCKATFCDDCLRVEKQAQNSRIVLWRDRNPQPPWEWRKAQRNQVATVSVTGTFHGNVKSHKFHKAGCRVYNCKNCVAGFDNREEAIAAGYVPCGMCKP